MVKKTPQKQSVLRHDKFVEWYVDTIVRGLVMFLFVGIGVTLVLRGIFNVSYVYVLPVIFLLSIALSPFTSKIKIGQYFQKRYNKIIDNIVKKVSKYEKKS